MRPANSSRLPAAGGFLAIARALPLLALIAVPNVGAQPSTVTFSTEVNLVVLNATVRNRKGEYVSGLEKADFQVFENGVPQAIGIFREQDAPVAVGLVVDNSTSMARKRHDVTAAALAFVRASNPQDQMFIVNFNERVSFGLPPTKLFSARTAELEAALNGAPARGRTALYDAVEAGLARLREATIERKALIVISDGGDNASRHARAQVLDDAARGGATIYAVGLFDIDDEDRDPGFLKALAHATGGQAFLPRETTDVVPICERIAAALRQQYTLGYAPSSPPVECDYRRIQVQANGRHGEKYAVSTRAGYLVCPSGKLR